MAIYTDSVYELAVVDEECSYVEVAIATVTVSSLWGYGVSLAISDTISVSEVYGDTKYADDDEYITVTATATPKTTVTLQPNNTARASASVVIGMAGIATDTATATSSVVAQPTLRPDSVATATSSVAVSTASTISSVLRIRVSSKVSLGMSELSYATVSAATSALFVSGFQAVLSDTVTASASLVLTTLARLAREDSASATSGVGHTAATNAVAGDGATFRSLVDYINPLAKAWVMNTETTAMSRYEGYDFESVAVHDGVLYGVNRDGIYKLDAATDAGLTIPAAVETGFLDLGSFQHKRVPTAYIGYRANGKLQLKVQTMENTAQSYTYETVSVPAQQPVNTKILIGKGLVSAYWKFTLSNKNGAYFDLDKWGVDVAVSQRRV